MTHADFLNWAKASTPWSRRPAEGIPEQWREELEEIWREHREVFDNIARSISKVGNIWTPTDSLREYSRRLSVEDQVAFYLALRESYGWRESEFRADFERGFPECVTALPPMRSRGEQQIIWYEVCAQSIPREEPF